MRSPLPGLYFQRAVCGKCGKGPGISEWKLLFQGGFLRAVIIGACIALLGQFMGINAVLLYGPSIFDEAGFSGSNSLLYQVLIGLVNSITTIIALLIVDKIGRKTLIYYGVSGMIISLFGFGPSLMAIFISLMFLYIDINIFISTLFSSIKDAMSQYLLENLQYSKSINLI